MRLNSSFKGERTNDLPEKKEHLVGWNPYDVGEGFIATSSEWKLHPWRFRHFGKRLAINSG